jgi:hypothetical protein
MEFLERFDYTIEYIQGEENKVADCLSRYYQSDLPGEKHPQDEYVNADIRLDPDGDDLPVGRMEECRAIRKSHGKAQSSVLKEVKEARVAEANALRPTEGKVSQDAKGVNGEITLKESLNGGDKGSLTRRIEGTSGLLDSIRSGYEKDKLLCKIVHKPEEFKMFELREGFLYSRNRWEEEVLCIPRTLHGKRSIPEILIDEAHSVLGHFGSRRTTDYIRRCYWWPTMVGDTAKYCASCGICQTIKTSNQQPQGLLHVMPIPSRPWELVRMDFVGPFPESRGFDYLWVIICRLTSMVHLIPVNVTIKAVDLAYLYLGQVVRLHGMPLSIVSDRDPKFTSKFWTELHRLVGTKLRMSTAFHPETDGASERVIRSVAQILRSMVAADQKDWADKVAMTEFAINSSVNASTGFAPFELNGGYMPRMITEMPEGAKAAPKGIRAFAEQALMNLMAAHDAIIASRVNQTFHANKRRRPEMPFDEGDEVYLSTENLNLPKGRARKLMPKYVGPYRILKSYPNSSSYRLDLPESLRKRRIHPTFHISRLRRHEKNDEVLFPHREVKVWYDFGDDDAEEWLVDDIIGHRWANKRVEFEVRWNLGDTTWEPYSHVKDLEALDDYLVLQGVSDCRSLPKRPA